MGFCRSEVFEWHEALSRGLPQRGSELAEAEPRKPRRRSLKCYFEDCQLGTWTAWTGCSSLLDNKCPRRCTWSWAMAVSNLRTKLHCDLLPGIARG